MRGGVCAVRATRNLQPRSEECNVSRKKTIATPERPHAFMVRLSDEERAALEGLAAKRRLTFADALRTAIMADAEKHGVAA